MGAHAGLGGNDGLHGAAVGIGRKTQPLGAYVLHSVTAAAGCGYVNVFKGVVGRGEHYVQLHGIRRADERALACLMTYHAECQVERIGPGVDVE